MELEQLLDRLMKGDPDARDHLRRMGPEAADAVAPLSDAVASGPRERRLDALFVLEGMGPAARAAVPALVGALDGEDVEVAAAGADVLGRVGGEAAGMVADQLESRSWRSRQAACQALAAMGADAAPAVPALLRRVEDEKDDVRQAAVRALGRIGDERALEPLAEIFTRDGGTIGCWIAEAFGRFGRRARRIAGALRDELHRDDPYLALASAAALGTIGVFEDAAVWTLISLLQAADDPEVRIEAALTLADFGPKAAPAIPALAAAQREDDEELRMQATVAIAKIRPEYGIAPDDRAAHAPRSSTG